MDLDTAKLIIFRERDNLHSSLDELLKQQNRILDKYRDNILNMPSDTLKELEEIQIVTRERLYAIKVVRRLSELIGEY